MPDTFKYLSEKSERFLEPFLKIEKSLFYIQKRQVFEYKKGNLSDFEDRYLVSTVAESCVF
jgi:hypothetical protein